MNKKNLQQIFQHYLEKFDYMNKKPSTEWYKWKIAKEFPVAMDRALAASEEDFPAALMQVQKLTENLIDNYTQPFYGLCKLAEKEPEEVRSMFRDLYADDGNNRTIKAEKVQSFLNRSLALCDKHYPGSFLYKDDLHSVTGYLFLYDPDHNYFYKYSHAKKFAKCIEFYDDWGQGGGVKLGVYYRMCDQLVEAIQEDPTFLTDRQKLMEQLDVKPEELHPDKEKHILAFDLIYCCSTYSLFDGIEIKPWPKPSDPPPVDIEKLKANFRAAAGIRTKRLEAEKYLQEVFLPGTKIHHKNKRFGDGVIQKADGLVIDVVFPSLGTEPKQLSADRIAANGLFDVVSGAPDFAERIQDYRDVLLKSASAIQDNYDFALGKVKDYLDELE